MKTGLIVALLAASYTMLAEDKLHVVRVVAVEYPRLANLARVQGTITLRALVNRNGTVSEVQTVSGPDLLLSPARTALLRWRFAGCKSEHMACSHTISFVFSLEGQCGKEHCESDFVADLPNLVVIKTGALRPIVD